MVHHKDFWELARAVCVGDASTLGPCQDVFFFDQAVGALRASDRAAHSLWEKHTEAIR